MKYSSFMPEEQSMSKRSRWFSTRVFPCVMGLTLALGVYTLLDKKTDEEFLKKEVVTLEGKVVDERYVPPALGNRTSTPSEYYFSIDDAVGRRLGIRVVNSYEPPLNLEYVDARLEKGTTVKVKARQVGEFEYKAFANEVYLK